MLPAMTIINISLTELRCLSFNKYDKREVPFRCNWLSSVHLLKAWHSHIIMSHTKRWKLSKGGEDNFFKRGQGGLSITIRKTFHPPSQPDSLAKISEKNND
ncbi:uncharacterized protein CDAR_85801 [Caerostris darwini]|uniref:Ycf15 n=1 Tax=Caerostris darwini TaxID=1538125 RepID=A0AAV4MZS0_9ARAC|nr:uncharacterized protein CDAR_85801 [Caerostris darwini]